MVIIPIFPNFIIYTLPTKTIKENDMDEFIERIMGLFMGIIAFLIAIAMVGFVIGFLEGLLK